MAKRGLGIDVLTAARERLDVVFRDFPKIVLSFSGGKDSTALLHLAAEAAERHNRKFDVMIVDMEAQYAATIDHISHCLHMHSRTIVPHWLCLPISLRNSGSMIEPTRS